MTHKPSVPSIMKWKSVRLPSAPITVLGTGTRYRVVSSASVPLKTHRDRSAGGGPAADRHINHVLHMMAVVQLRTKTTEGRAYYDRKTAAGKRPNEAMRCLKRRLSDIVYRTLLDDVVTTSGTGPGGHRGASLISSAAGSQPHTDTSGQSLFPDPSPTTIEPPSRPLLDTEGCQFR